MGKSLSILAIMLVIALTAMVSILAINTHVCTASKLGQNRTVGQGGLSYRKPGKIHVRPSTIGNPANIDTTMFSIYNRHRTVFTTVTWNDGFTTDLEWFVVANIYVVYKNQNGVPVASWYVPAVEVQKKYNIKEGGFWSGYHVDDTMLLESVSWWGDWGYDDLFFDQASIHYIPKPGRYGEGGSSTWTLSAGISNILSVQVTWTHSSSGKEEASVDTYSNMFIGIYNDMHGAMEVHSAYPYNGVYADWAVALACRTDKLEKGSIIISRPQITVEYDRWNYGGIQYHWESKDIKIPIDAADLVYNYDNYRDGHNASIHAADRGTWG